MSGRFELARSDSPSLPWCSSRPGQLRRCSTSNWSAVPSRASRCRRRAARHGGRHHQHRAARTGGWRRQASRPTGARNSWRSTEVYGSGAGTNARCATQVPLAQAHCRNSSKRGVCQCNAMRPSALRPSQQVQPKEHQGCGQGNSTNTRVYPPAARVARPAIAGSAAAGRTGCSRDERQVLYQAGQQDVGIGAGRRPLVCIGNGRANDAHQRSGQHMPHHQQQAASATWAAVGGAMEAGKYGSALRRRPDCHAGGSSRGSGLFIHSSAPGRRRSSRRWRRLHQPLR